ncbi:MAG: MTAP family purine nucleoside phosphorylase [Acidimicrobiia bacterium]
MGRLAVIGGTGVRESAFGVDAQPITVEGVALLDAGDHVVLQRHGFDRYVRAHEIDHRANVLALLAAGCDRVLGLSSTGSLRVDWPVGTFACPNDFYAPQVNDTVHDDARSHTIPAFDPVWRARLLETWREHAATTIVDGGVYAQTRGPRFETPAEVRALAKIGDLVGMTIAAECILSKEVGLAYAAICVVDNLANGLDVEPLTIEQFRAAVTANRTALLADLDTVIPVLTGSA